MKLQSLAAENTIKIIAVHEAANNNIHQSYINSIFHHFITYNLKFYFIYLQLPITILIVVRKPFETYLCKSQD